MSWGVTSVEDGCTCGGMAACQQCQDRDAATPVADDRARVIERVLMMELLEEYGEDEETWRALRSSRRIATAIVAALSDWAAPGHNPTTSPEDHA